MSLPKLTKEQLKFQDAEKAKVQAFVNDYRKLVEKHGFDFSAKAILEVIKVKQNDNLSPIITPNK